MFLTNKELLVKGSFQRFLGVPIHPNDRKKENAVSSLADVQAISQEFKERMVFMAQKIDGIAHDSVHSNFRLQVVRFYVLGDSFSADPIDPLRAVLATQPEVMKCRSGHGNAALYVLLERQITQPYSPVMGASPLFVQYEHYDYSAKAATGVNPAVCTSGRLAVWWVPCGLWTAEATDSLCHPGGEVHVNSRSSWQKPGREVAFKNEGLQCALKSHSSSANCHFDSPGLHWLVTARKLTLSTSVKLLLIYQPSADAAGAPSAHLGPSFLCLLGHILITHSARIQLTPTRRAQQDSRSPIFAPVDLSVPLICVEATPWGLSVKTVRFVTVFEKDKMIPPLNSAALFNCLRDAKGENWGSHGIMVPPGVQSSVGSGCYEAFLSWTTVEVIICQLAISVESHFVKADNCMLTDAVQPITTGLETGIKGHGSSSCVIPKTSAKSNSARRSSSSISPPLEGDILCDSRLCKAVGVALGFGLSSGIGRQKHAAVHVHNQHHFLKHLDTSSEGGRERSIAAQVVHWSMAGHSSGPSGTPGLMDLAQGQMSSRKQEQVTSNWLNQIQ
ncbi:hypothetical protein Anapl_13390 [Anas platyrhynchos]|uniref:Uncharacterized protein n=1 Tax=Anas platyrhynchos TaxID=8839 RepID=R0LGJ3_ANAPL|nr:hypothetical protein Anapl_13390 [Anas platyrhynchos]